MKKFLMPFMLLLAVVVISSCEKEDEDTSSEMIGLYSGNVNTNSDLKIFYNPVVDVDTTFSTLDATAEISEHDNADSLNLQVKLTIDGTPITIKVPAYKSSNNSLTISNYPYKYLVVNMIVNGTATVNGDELSANLTIENGVGNPDGTIITGDLDFVGTK